MPGYSANTSPTLKWEVLKLAQLGCLADTETISVTCGDDAKAAEHPITKFIGDDNWGGEIAVGATRAIPPAIRTAGFESAGGKLCDLPASITCSGTSTWEALALWERKVPEVLKI